MSSHLIATHPVMDAIVALHAALDAVLGDALDPAAGYDVAWLSAADKRTALLSLTAAGARLEALRLRVLAAGESLGDVAADDGSRDAAAWLAAHAHLDNPHARRLSRLATALDRRWTQVGAGLAAGRYDTERAAAVIKALDDLPDDLDPDIVTRAEAQLVADAESFDPRRLQVLGRRVLAHVAPEVAEAHEAALLARDDVRAEHTTYLRMRRRGDGTVDLTARISDLTAHRLQTYLDAHTSPRRPEDPPEPSGSTSRQPWEQKMGHAFSALLESVDPDRLPLHGGDATTVVVTIDLATLTDQLGSAGVALVGDQPLTAAQARRLACTADILPAVLGADSQVLDLGRTRRLFTRAQRRALALRHPTCAAHGCDIPAPWCEAHHANRPWSRGGATDLTDGALLCSHHHHRAHDPRYDTTRHPDGTLRFHRRT